MCLPVLRAIRTATKKSPAPFRRRLGGRGSGFFTLEQPFFTVSLQLAVPNVICNPALTDIQAAINAAAKKVGIWHLYRDTKIGCPHNV